MSIPVDVERLAEALGAFGSGYLLTVSPTGQVKALTIDPVVSDGLVVVAGAGRGTLANLAGNRAVTMVFPPAMAHGYTLIVDGIGRGEGEDVVVVPETAVLHRPSAHAAGRPPPSSEAAADGCGQDCRPV